MFEEEADPDASIADKTVTLSIVEGSPLLPPDDIVLMKCADGLKVEAQTPDGTRVATPSNSKEGAATHNPRQVAGKVSYAAALKAKPTDWHIEFSMDDHVLPLDLTIYGAIHQHEMRKASGAVPPSLIWQGVYTIKFKKVLGPLPSAEGAHLSLKPESWN